MHLVVGIGTDCAGSSKSNYDHDHDSSLTTLDKDQ